jgi:hypothetical protein
MNPTLLIFCHSIVPKVVHPIGEGAGGTPRCSNFSLRLKKSHSSIPFKAHDKRSDRKLSCLGPYVWVSKVYVLKHKLKTDSCVVLTDTGPLCMSGCEIYEIFSTCVRRLLLN